MTDEATAKYRIVHQPHRALKYRAEHRTANRGWEVLETAYSEQVAREVISEHMRRATHGEQESVIAYIG